MLTAISVVFSLFGMPANAQQISDEARVEVVRQDLATRGYSLDGLTIENGRISLSLS